MSVDSGNFAGCVVALLAEGVDRNPKLCVFAPNEVSSPSSRRAWIEIDLLQALLWFWLVALLAEGVDRNQFSPVVFRYRRVALLAEGVDRNCCFCLFAKYHVKVALLAEGVDRN